MQPFSHFSVAAWPLRLSGSARNALSRRRAADAVARYAGDLPLSYQTKAVRLRNDYPRLHDADKAG
jgi:hypothetical protein